MREVYGGVGESGEVGARPVWENFNSFVFDIEVKFAKC